MKIVCSYIQTNRDRISFEWSLKASFTDFFQKWFWKKIDIKCYEMFFTHQWIYTCIKWNKFSNKSIISQFCENDIIFTEMDQSSSILKILIYEYQNFHFNKLHILLDRLPLNPSGQSQRNPSTPSTQTPPFSHFVFWQSSMFISQFVPENPETQEHS